MSEFIYDWTPNKQHQKEEIVRCRDCAKWSFFDVEDGWFRCTHFDRPTRRDGFCAWGERRDA